MTTSNYRYLVKMGVDATDFEKGADDVQDKMDETEDKVDKKTKEMTNDFRGFVTASRRMVNDFGRAMAGFSAIMLGAAAVTARLGVGVFSAQEEVDQMAKVVGISAERMSGWLNVAKEMNLDARGMRDVFGDVGVKIVEMEADFDRFGISIRGTHGELVNQEEALLRVADAMHKNKNSTTQKAIADILMSTAGRDLTPVLLKGRDAIEAQFRAMKKAGQLMTGFEAKAGRMAMGSIKSLGISFMNLGSALAGSFGPAVILIVREVGRVVSKMAGWLRKNNQLVKSNIKEWLIWMGSVGLPKVAKSAIWVSRAFHGLSQLYTLLQQGAAKYFNLFGRGMSAVLGKMAEFYDFVSPSSGLGARFRRMADQHAIAAADMQADVDDYSDQLAAAEQAQRELEESIKGAGDSGAKALKKIVAQIDKIIGRIRTAKDEADDDEEKKKAAYRKELQRQADYYRRLGAHEEARRLMRELNLENEHRRLEMLAQHETEIAKKTAKDYQAKFDQIKQGAQEVGRLAVESFQDIGRTVDGQTKTMGDAFKQFFGGLAKMLLNATLNFVQAKATEMAATRASAVANVKANAAEAGSGAAKSQAGIPYVGPILAGVAMAAMLASVLGLLSGFNQGGIVGSGSAANVDSTLIRATKGEMVLPRELSQGILAVASGKSAPSRARASLPTPSAPEGSSQGLPQIVLAGSPHAFEDPISRRKFARYLREVWDDGEV